MFLAAMQGEYDEKYAPLNKVAIGFAKVDGIIVTLQERLDEWEAGGGFQTDKVQNLKVIAEELKVNIAGCTIRFIAGGHLVIIAWLTRSVRALGPLMDRARTCQVTSVTH